MKKRIPYFLIMLCFLLSGCGKKQEENLCEESTVTLNNYLDEMPLLEAPIREYGEEAGYIQFEDDLKVRILYPEGEIEALNEAIKTWVNETVDYYRKESVGASACGDSAELTAEYDSYLINGEIVSVKMNGLYDHPDQDYHIEIAAAFHASVKTKELISSEEAALVEAVAEKVLFSVVDPQKPMIALTFDDGPSKHTAKLLDVFATYGGKGTFFVVGNLLDNRNEVIRRIVMEGHEIGGHSWSHRQLTNLNAEELTDQLMTTRAKIYEITGVDSTLIRPPYGSYNDQVKDVCKKLGIHMVNWSVDTMDWEYKDANRIYDTIMSEAKDGDIILCHDLYGTTVEAMERVVPDLIAAGYQLVTVTELLSYGDRKVSAGNVYYKISERK